QRIAQGQCIHDRSDHAHVVGGGLVHATLHADLAAPQVATADHDADLHAKVYDRLNSLGYKIRLIGVNSPAVPRKRLTAELEHNSLVARFAAVIRLMTVHVRTPLLIERLCISRKKRGPGLNLIPFCKDMTNYSASAFALPSASPSANR